MSTVNRENILNKTHYGLTIYTHILRQYYSEDIVLHLVERDCGLCRNPFNSDKETLHIFIEKAQARHEDKETAIPAGDAFDFAELHYKQNGNQLLQTLNKELFLHIGEQRNFYKNPYYPHPPNHGNHKNPINHGSDNGGFLFSFFRAPITNTTPHKTVTLLQVYNAIKGTHYKSRTEKLRSLLSPLSCGEGLGERSLTRSGERSLARSFKATNFDYCTFSGTFTTRTDKALIKHSGLLCLDFDHLQDIDTLRTRLLQDEYFETQLLFVSPSGNGLKWIIQISPTDGSPPEGDLGGFLFTAIANYILQTYGITVDKSGRDLSRACFLPHDPQAYINPQLLNL